MFPFEGKVDYSEPKDKGEKTQLLVTLRILQRLFLQNELDMKALNV